MRFAKCWFGMIFGFSLVLYGGVFSRGPVRADDMQMTTCPIFTAMRWVSPMPPNNSGNRYALTLNKHEMTCAQAQTWATKLLAQHMAGKPQMPIYPPLKGGPPGYRCTASPDTTGHAYQGHCEKIGGGPFAPSFNWGTP